MECPHCLNHFDPQPPLDAPAPKLEHRLLPMVVAGFLLLMGFLASYMMWDPGQGFSPMRVVSVLTMLLFLAAALIAFRSAKSDMKIQQ